ncbi:amino acid transporter [Violaceomyces palustris]|uniref:Amino acid transporter n=1 Tax=Violaceomyces palustris TaxID=1673888 RepID=A0ACD0NU99_9BASI|nr:amino acid transporter [Violaceomyces palustris]
MANQQVDSDVLPVLSISNPRQATSTRSSSDFDSKSFTTKSRFDDLGRNPGWSPSPNGEVADPLHHPQPSNKDVSGGGGGGGGAPVEAISALGQQVGWVTVVALNFSQMIGTGIFSTPGSIAKSLGSVGASLLVWVIGIVISFAGLAVYTEFASYYPNRAGAEVVYLEKAYPRPRYLLTVTFAFQTVLLSFSSSNCIVFATYVLRACGAPETEWREKSLAVGAMAFACLVILLSTKWSLRVSNALSYLKVIILTFVAISGLVVLAGGTKVKGVRDHNFHDAFRGTSKSGNAWAQAVVKIVFSFAGWNNANNVLNEIPNPVRTIKIWSPISLSIVSVLYILAGVAYFSAIPLEEIKSSKTLTAALYFEKVFGTTAGAKVLPALVAVSAMGNIIAVAIGQSRVLREVGRQGVLPYPSLWSSTKPFGTPLFPLVVKFTLTAIMILAPPFGDAFNFVVDLASYPSQFFNLLMVLGLFRIRYWRKRNDRDSEVEGGSEEIYKAWDVALITYALVALFLLIAPWLPPAGGAKGGDVSFWYATYCAVGIAVILVCFLYYLVRFVLIPRARGYRWQDEVVTLDDGSVTNRLVKVYKSE